MARIIGKTPINPLVFFTGKISGYYLWIWITLKIYERIMSDAASSSYHHYISLVFYSLGIIIAGISLINLGRSTSLGVPDERTILKKNGLYKLSRNPMYLGFNLITLSAIIYEINYLNLSLGIYSMITYHMIIKAEEIFLKDRFKKDFTNYCKRTRRYM